MATDFQITKEMGGEILTVHINGDLNVKTSPILEDELKNSISGVKELALDFADVEYISSAGLRVLLGTWNTFHRRVCACCWLWKNLCVVKAAK